MLLLATVISVKMFEWQRKEKRCEEIARLHLD
jgi:hypothetical protein